MSSRDIDVEEDDYGTVELQNNEAVVYQDDPAGTYVEEVIYDDQEEEEINIHNVDGEIEVDAGDEAWMIPIGRPTTSARDIPVLKVIGAPSVVLKTMESLRMRPRLHVTSGKQRLPSHTLQGGDADDYQDDNDIGVDGTKIPGIREALRLYSDAAIRNTPNLRIEDIEEELETDFDPIQEEADTQTHDPQRKQTVFKHKDWQLFDDRPIDFQEACEIICGAARHEIDKKLICTSIPQLFKGEGTFIIDLNSLRNRQDVNGDGLGTWGRPQGRHRYYTRSNNMSVKLVRADDGKGKLLRGAKYVWKCVLRRYEHPVTTEINQGANRFVKKIYTALYPADVNKGPDLVVVTYEWIGRQPFDFPVVGGARRRNPSVDNWETNSFHGNIPRAIASTSRGFYGDIPIYSDVAVDFDHAAAVILGGVAIEPNKIAVAVPQGFRESGTFVVDVDLIQAEAMLRRDDNGVWGKPAGTSRYYIIDSNSFDAIRIDTHNRAPQQGHDLQVLCKRYEHPSVGGRFVRKIYTGRTTASSTNPHRITLAVLTYHWKGPPVAFEQQKKQNLVLAVEQRYNGDSYEAHSERSEPRKRPRTEIKAATEEAEESRSEKEFRQAVWKKEYENQMRFSGLLDRAEAFIGRLERASGNVIYTQENGMGQQEWVQQTSTQPHAQEDS